MVRGEKLTELQALQALLIPSGNNIVSLLARCDAGLQAAFVAKMSAAADPAGLRSTRCADVSGADPATPSTAAGPCPAALSSFVAKSQLHLCPGSHRYMFTARAQG